MCVNETEHGDRVIYCDVADRYLLGRTPDGECPFCGEDLTGERLEQLRERVAEHTGRDDLFTDGGTPTGDTVRKIFTPICPDCGAEGEIQRRVRGKWQCLDCGNRYDRTDIERGDRR